MTENGEIVYQFYRKPIANKHTVMKTAAMDKHQKTKALSDSGDYTIPVNIFLKM